MPTPRAEPGHAVLLALVAAAATAVLLATGSPGKSQSPTPLTTAAAWRGLVGSRPRDAVFVDGGRKLWVSSEQRGTISVFDVASRKIIDTIDLVAAFPDIETVQAVELDMTRDGKRAFVAMGRANQVAEIDPRTLKVVRSFPTGERTWGIGLSPDDKRLYAASGLSGDRTIIDLQSNKVLKRVKLGGHPWGVLAAPR